MKLYIAGPMRGIRLYNFPAFFRCAMDLRKLHHEVVNPAETDMAAGFNPGAPYDQQPAFSIFDSLALDYRLVLGCEGIVMLPGWEMSRHACIERAIAESTNRAVFNYRPDARYEDVLERVFQGEINIQFEHS